jgi:hypothetical protein
MNPKLFFFPLKMNMRTRITTYVLFFYVYYYYFFHWKAHHKKDTYQRIESSLTGKKKKKPKKQEQTKQLLPKPETEFQQRTGPAVEPVLTADDGCC